MIIVIIAGCIENPSGPKPQTATAPSGPLMQDVTGQIGILPHQGAIYPGRHRFQVSGSARTTDYKPGKVWNFAVTYDGAGTSVGNDTIDIAD